MHSTTQQSGNTETALRFIFAPILIAYVIGSLPVLVPVVAARWLSRRIAGGPLRTSSAEA